MPSSKLAFPDLPVAEELLLTLVEQMRPHVDPATTVLVGIHTGGVWVAQRLASALGLLTPCGSIDASLYRDDYHQRGLHTKVHGKKASQIPFEVDHAHVIIVDDVLHTGRTIRAATNELFDYGRPDCVDLAVLVDRGGRELPIAARYCPLSFLLPSAQTLELEQTANGQLAFHLVDHSIDP